MFSKKRIAVISCGHFFDGFWTKNKCQKLILDIYFLLFFHQKMQKHGWCKIYFLKNNTHVIPVGTFLLFFQIAKLLSKIGFGHLFLSIFTLPPQSLSLFFSVFLQILQIVTFVITTCNICNLFNIFIIRRHT